MGVFGYLNKSRFSGVVTQIRSIVRQKGRTARFSAKGCEIVELMEKFSKKKFLKTYWKNNSMFVYWQK